MSILKIVNVLFFQWFCIRLTKCTENIIEDYKLESFSLVSDYPNSIGARGSGKTVKYEWYSLQYWILPLTGWIKIFKNNKFIYLNKNPEFLKITKRIKGS